MSEEIQTTVGGATVTIAPEMKPSEALAATGDGRATVTDTRGRTIKLQKPGVLAQFQLVEALGNVAQNQVYMGMVLPLLFVVSIDSDLVVKPGSKAEVEALILRLDEDGVEAVMKGVQKYFGAPEEDEQKNG